MVSFFKSCIAFVATVFLLSSNASAQWFYDENGNWVSGEETPNTYGPPVDSGYYGQNYYEQNYYEQTYYEQNYYDQTYSDDGTSGPPSLDWNYTDDDCNSYDDYDEYGNWSNGYGSWSNGGCGESSSGSSGSENPSLDWNYTDDDCNSYDDYDEYGNWSNGGSDWVGCPSGSSGSSGSGSENQFTDSDCNSYDDYDGEDNFDNGTWPWGFNEYGYVQCPTEDSKTCTDKPEDKSWSDIDAEFGGVSGSGWSSGGKVAQITTSFGVDLPLLQYTDKFDSQIGKDLWISANEPKLAEMSEVMRTWFYLCGGKDEIPPPPTFNISKLNMDPQFLRKTAAWDNLSEETQGLANSVPLYRLQFDLHNKVNKEVFDKSGALFAQDCRLTEQLMTLLDIEIDNEFERAAFTFAASCVINNFRSNLSNNDNQQIAAISSYLDQGINPNQYSLTNWALYDSSDWHVHLSVAIGVRTRRGKTYFVGGDTLAKNSMTFHGQEKKINVNFGFENIMRASGIEEHHLGSGAGMGVYVPKGNFSEWRATATFSYWF